MPFLFCFLLRVSCLQWKWRPGLTASRLSLLIGFSSTPYLLCHQHPHSSPHPPPDRLALQRQFASTPSNSPFPWQQCEFHDDFVPPLSFHVWEIPQGSVPDPLFTFGYSYTPVPSPGISIIDLNTPSLTKHFITALWVRSFHVSTYCLP